MRLPLNCLVVAALLSSIPFASFVQSYPMGEHIGVEEYSKRVAVKPNGPKPDSPKPSSPKPSSVKPSSVKPSSVKPSSVKPSSVKPSSVKPTSSTPNNPKPTSLDPFRDPSTSPDPFRDPSISPSISDPFRDPSHSPSLPGSPDSVSTVWRGFAIDDLKLKDPAQEGMRAKGAGLLQDLEQAILHQSPSKKPESVKESGYTGQGDLFEPPKLKIGSTKNPYDEIFGIKVDKDWRGDDITKPGSTTIVKTYEDPSQKAMIISQSWNRETDPGGKLTWSAMVMSNWREAAIKEHAAISDLKYIIRNNIQLKTVETSDKKLELNTINAMNGAFDAMKVERTKTMALDFKTTDKTMLQQVSIMSAQTHIARVLQMLKDYRGEFQDQQISKIYLQTKDNPVSDYQYNIIIELGK